MEIYVKMLEPKTTTFKVDSSDTVDSLKVKIYERWMTPAPYTNLSSLAATKWTTTAPWHPITFRMSLLFIWCFAFVVVRPRLGGFPLAPASAL